MKVTEKVDVSMYLLTEYDLDEENVAEHFGSLENMELYFDKSVRDYGEYKPSDFSSEDEFKNYEKLKSYVVEILNENNITQHVGRYLEVFGVRGKTDVGDYQIDDDHGVIEREILVGSMVHHKGMWGGSLSDIEHLDDLKFKVGTKYKEQETPEFRYFFIFCSHGIMIKLARLPKLFFIQLSYNS